MTSSPRHQSHHHFEASLHFYGQLIDFLGSILPLDLLELQCFQNILTGHINSRGAPPPICICLQDEDIAFWGNLTENTSPDQFKDFSLGKTNQP